LATLVLLAAVWAPAAASAPSAASPHPDDGQWSDAFFPRDLDGPATCSAVYDGLLVLGGRFTTAGSEEIPHLAVWDGSSLETFGGGAGGPVLALLPFDGGLVAGGDFETIGGQAIPRLAFWDGTGWSPLGRPFDGPVSALAVYENRLVAAGSFTRAGDDSVGRAAEWDGQTWRALGGGPSHGVRSLAAHGAALFAAVEILDAPEGAPCPLLIWDGTAWECAGLDLENGAGGVNDLALFHGDLIAGGSFLLELEGDTTAVQIARWDGETWDPLASGFDAGVWTLAVYQDRLVAGGPFSRYGAETVSTVAVLDGGSWIPLGTEASSRSTAGSASDLAVYNDRLVASGSGLGSGLPAAHVAQWNGERWAPLVEEGSGFTGGAPSALNALVSYNGHVVAAGAFGNVGGVAARNIALWDGRSWHPLGGGFDGEVHALHVHGGDLYAAGRFTRAGGVEANSVARWDGSDWYPLGSGVGGFARTLATFEDDLIAGGHFATAGGVNAPRVARWDGTAWSGFGEGIGADPLDEVLALAVYKGALYAGGQFSISGARVTRNIARWDGTEWAQPLYGLDNQRGFSYVAALCVYDGLLVAGGSFDHNGPSVVNRIALWNGSGWDSLGSGVGVDDDVVNALAVYSGGLVAGGEFQTAGGDSASHIARWDGAGWTALGSGTDGWVSTLAANDSTLYAGGPFRAAGGKPSVGIARWMGLLPPGPPVSASLLILPIQPNPIRGGTKITFSLIVPSSMRLTVHDALGRGVATLLERPLEAGRHVLFWDGSATGGGRLPSGVYFIRLRSETAGVSSRKVVLVH
jgi:hypothetical protein